MGEIKNRKSIAASHLHSYTDWTSAHGVPQIGRSRHYFCIGFWSIISLIGLGLLIWQTTLLILQYYSYDVAVQMSLKFNQRAFPAVTICNLNAYKKSVIYKDEKVRRLMNTYEYTMKKMACSADPKCTFETNSTMDNFQQLYHFKDLTDSAALQSRANRVLALELLGLNLSEAIVDVNDFMQGCSFDTQDCDPLHWTPFFDPIMGGCFTFNKERQNLAMRSGPTYGLRIVLKTNISEFISTSDTAGFKVYVHDQGEYPFPDVFGYNVQTGSAASLAVQYKEISRMGPPYSDCSNEMPDGYLYPLNYTTEACQRTFYQVKMVKNCGCYDPHFPPLKNVSDTKACTVADNYDCWLQETNITVADTVCTQPCNEGMYEVTLSSATWPSGSVPNVGKCEEGMYANKTCIQVFQEQGAMVEVYYEKLNYQTMTESASYTIVSLLSDFGGQIGLWLGMSAISIVEVFVLVFQLCVTGVSPKAGQALNF